MRMVPDATWGVLTVFAEARGEPADGKTAVAEVIMNRVRRKYQCDGTVADCVLRPHQFSCWSTADPNRRLAALVDDDDAIVKECVSAWLRAMAGSQLAKGAVLYLAPSSLVVQPEWVKWTTLVATIGHHNFYTDP